MSALTDYLDALDNYAGGWNLASTSSDDPDESGNGNDGVVTIGSGARGDVAIDPGGTLSMDYDGTSTKVVVAADAAISNIWDAGGTFFVLMHPDGPGEGSAGQIISRTALQPHIAMDSPSGGISKLRFSKQFTVVSGTWRSTDTIITHGSSYALIITYNADATTNDPTFYRRLLGSGTTDTYTVGSGITEATTPSGTRSSDSAQALTIGNGGALDSATFDGRLSVVRFYSDVLTAGEIDDIMELADPTAPVDATVISVAATATATGKAPGVSLTIGDVAATATASASPPVVSTPASHDVIVIAATATASATAPGLSLTLGDVAATATASAPAPAPTIVITSVAAAALAAANVPVIGAIGPGALFAIPGPEPSRTFPHTKKGVYARFRDEDGVFYDPTTVTFGTRNPVGTVTEYQFGVASNVSQQAIGVYLCIVTVDREGTWTFAAQGEDGDAVTQVELVVEPSILD